MTWSWNHSGKNIWIAQKIPFCLIPLTWGLEWGGSHLFTIYQHALELNFLSLMHTDLVTQNGMISIQPWPNVPLQLRCLTRQRSMLGQWKGLMTMIQMTCPSNWWPCLCIYCVVNTLFFSFIFRAANPPTPLCSHPLIDNPSPRAPL